jgi:hypothetical protein
MKLHFQKSTADTLSISKSILTQNGIKTDLSKVEVFQQDEKDSLEQPDIYKDSSGMVNVLLHVDPERFFFSQGGKFKDLDGVEYTYNNYMIFHGVDIHGDISIEQFTDYVTCYNKSTEDRTAEHDQVKLDAGWPKGVLQSKLDPAFKVAWLMRGVKK